MFVANGEDADFSLYSSQLNLKIERAAEASTNEKFAFLEDLHYFRRNHPFPGAISRLQFGQCVGRIRRISRLRLSVPARR